MEACRWRSQAAEITRARPPIALSGNPELFIASCAAHVFKNRYASGTLAFEAGDIDIHAFEAADPDIRRICDALMSDFEDTAFAGIPEEHRPHIVWNAHTDKGRLDLNCVFARAIDTGEGKLRSFNPKSPGTLGDTLWSAFQNLWNHRYGWADPNDPARARRVKRPKAAHKGPRTDQSGVKIKDIREQITDALYQQINAGEISNRENVFSALAAMGYTLNRKSKAFVSVNAVADGAAAKPIRLQGDIYAVDFQGLDWLNARRTAAPKADFDSEESAMQQLLDEVRQSHGLFLKKRLKITMPSETEVDERLVLRDQLQDPEAEGYCETESNGFKQQARPKDWQRSFEGKLWEELYSKDTLPSDLEAKLRYVDPRTKSVWLDDKSSIQDLGDKMRGYRSTAATLHLMVLQAKAKSWSGIRMSGSEDILRQTARLAFAEGVEIEGKTNEMQTIIQDELAKLRVEAELAKVPAHEPAPTPEPATAPVPGRNQTPAPRPVFDPMAKGNGLAFALEQGPIPTKRKRHFAEFYEDENAKHLYHWDDLYGYGTLPSSLRPSITYVHRDPATVRLKDRALIKDQGKRITVQGSSEDALRIIIAQAKAKGWTGLSVRGSEEYLRMAAKVACEAGFPIRARAEHKQDMFNIRQRAERTSPKPEKPSGNLETFYTNGVRTLSQPE